MLRLVGTKEPQVFIFIIFFKKNKKNNKSLNINQLNENIFIKNKENHFFCFLLDDLLLIPAIQ